MALSDLFEVMKNFEREDSLLGTRIRESRCVNRWIDAVGDGIASHTTVFGLVDGVLRVQVDHPIWKTELILRKRQILEKLNQTADSAEWLVSDILFLDFKKSKSRRD